MRSFFSILILLVSVSLSSAQKPTEILATANGKNYTAADLSAEAQQVLTNEPMIIANARNQLLEKMITDALIDAEAKAKGVTRESLITAERAKVADPTDAQIAEVFGANRSAFGDKTLTEVRKQIVEFLRGDQEDAALKKYVETLAAKYKPVRGKDINAADLKSLDLLFSVGQRSYTARDFDEKYKLVLYDVKADLLDQIEEETESAVYLALLETEAKAQNTDSGTLLGREITNKMREFSDEERIGLESAFRDRLYTKYKAKILIKFPPPIVQNISVDDDPSRGPAAAPVTIVMFSDFQCPACSATHPVLQKVIGEYGDKVRLVVRDFPLVGIHEHAFRAALAANAANAQGKFFEYADILYKNQSALDDASLSKYAASIGLNVKRFELDLSSENTAAEVRKDMADGVSYGISGTPTIFVNGVKVRHLSAEGFREAIDAALGKK